MERHVETTVGKENILKLKLDTLVVNKPMSIHTYSTREDTNGRKTEKIGNH